MLAPTYIRTRCTSHAEGYPVTNGENYASFTVTILTPKRSLRTARSLRLSRLLGDAHRSGLALRDGDMAGLGGDPLQPGAHRREPIQVEAPLAGDVRVGV